MRIYTQQRVDQCLTADPLGGDNSPDFAASAGFCLALTVGLGDRLCDQAPRSPNTHNTLHRWNTCFPPRCHGQVGVAGRPLPGTPAISRMNGVWGGEGWGGLTSVPALSGSSPSGLQSSKEILYSQGFAQDASPGLDFPNKPSESFQSAEYT